MLSSGIDLYLEILQQPIILVEISTVHLFHVFEEGNRLFGEPALMQHCRKILNTRVDSLVADCGSGIIFQSLDQIPLFCFIFLGFFIVASLCVVVHTLNCGFVFLLENALKKMDPWPNFLPIPCACLSLHWKLSEKRFQLDADLWLTQFQSKYFCFYFLQSLSWRIFVVYL